MHESVTPRIHSLFVHIGCTIARTVPSKPKSTSTHPTIGPKIRWHRQDRLGWKLRDLGARSGITYTLIGRWERQEADPDFGQASKLARALGISVESLWDTSPPPRDVQEKCT